MEKTRISINKLKDLYRVGYIDADTLMELVTEEMEKLFFNIREEIEEEVK